MEQTKIESMIEITLNMSSGFVVSWMVWMFIVPILFPEHRSTVDTAFWLTVLFTVTSWLRSYGWRRFFAQGLHKIVQRWAAIILTKCFNQ